MIAKAFTAALSGLDALPVTIETDLSNGLPSFDIVGLPDAAVKEAKERVSAALRNSGFTLPPRKIVINLAPADIKKEGSIFDLAIALSLLAADEQLPKQALSSFTFYGELSLSGELKHINGMLSLAASGVQNGRPQLVVPAENAGEASLAQGAHVYGAHTLHEVVAFLTGEASIEETATDASALLQNLSMYETDFADVKGQPLLKRALEVSAAGGHNVLIMGSPGSGKSMLAKRLPTILPDMTVDEAIDTTRIYSAAGLLEADRPLMATRPFRAPHHNISMPGLIGGGSHSSPGEISLAHNGVLFLDEFLEFSPKAMESMRQPLEDGRVTIARASATNTYPCKMMLILAANPCPCGYHGDPRRRCICSQTAINKYLSKISGPLLDRIDIQVEALSISYGTLSEASGESSAAIKQRVNAARAIQRRRFQSDTKLNADMKTEEDLNAYCALNEECRTLLENAYRTLGLSVRGYTSLLTVARTIADLDGEENIGIMHLSEAISYRKLEGKYWGR